MFGELPALNEIDALEEIVRQNRLAAFLKESGGNWARLENVLEQLDKKDILIGRYMSHCPDCAGSNLELSAAKRLESGRKMAGVCYYQDSLEATSAQLYLQYFSTELNSVYGGVSGNCFGANKNGDAHLRIRTMISNLLSLEKLEFKINEKFDGFEIQGPWDFESQEVYYQDGWGDEREK